MHCSCSIWCSNSGLGRWQRVIILSLWADTVIWWSISDYQCSVIASFLAFQHRKAYWSHFILPQVKQMLWNWHELQIWSGIPLHQYNVTGSLIESLWFELFIWIILMITTQFHVKVSFYFSLHSTYCHKLIWFPLE